MKKFMNHPTATFISTQKLLKITLATTVITNQLIRKVAFNALLNYPHYIHMSFKEIVHSFFFCLQMQFPLINFHIFRIHLLKCTINYENIRVQLWLNGRYESECEMSQI